MHFEQCECVLVGDLPLSRSAGGSDPGPFSHKHSLYRFGTYTQGKVHSNIFHLSYLSTTITSDFLLPSGLQIIGKKPTTSWAVICGAADPHPLDLLSISASETSSSCPINSSISFFPCTCECHTFSFSLFPNHSFSPLCPYWFTHSKEGGEKKLTLNNEMNFLSAVKWLIILGGKGWQLLGRENKKDIHEVFVCQTHAAFSISVHAFQQHPLERMYRRTKSGSFTWLRSVFPRERWMWTLIC